MKVWFLQPSAAVLAIAGVGLFIKYNDEKRAIPKGIVLFSYVSLTSADNVVWLVVNYTIQCLQLSK